MDTKLKFRPIMPDDMSIIGDFFAKRPNKTCDSMPIDSFIWRKYYDLQIAVSDGRAVQLLMRDDEGYFSAMPSCSEGELSYFFEEILRYFNDELKAPLRINLADEEAVSFLNLKSDDRFEVTEETELRDYLYKGDALRKLSGKKLHKKKNHLNFFLREYAGRYEYRRLGAFAKAELLDFLSEWRLKKLGNDSDKLNDEICGVRDFLENCDNIPSVMAGVYIDGKLAAFTVGSFNPYENMAIIHVEKADMDIRGLYQFINQQFLLNEFPDAQLVNREDDAGDPGLRKAKESYAPYGYANKYKIIQKTS